MIFMVLLLFLMITNNKNNLIMSHEARGGWVILANADDIYY